MKKTAAFIALAAVACASALPAFASEGTTGGDNIIEDVVSGAGDIVEDVVSGAEDIVTPGDSTSINDNVSAPDTTSVVTPGETTSVPENVNTGVPAAELAALGAAAVGGLTAMTIVIRKRK